MFFAMQKTWRDLVLRRRRRDGTACHSEGKNDGEISPLAEDDEADPPEEEIEDEVHTLVKQLSSFRNRLKQ